MLPKLDSKSNNKSNSKISRDFRCSLHNFYVIVRLKTVIIKRREAVRVIVLEEGEGRFLDFMKVSWWRMMCQFPVTYL